MGSDSDLATMKGAAQVGAGAHNDYKPLSMAALTFRVDFQTHTTRATSYKSYPSMQAYWEVTTFIASSGCSTEQKPQCICCSLKCYKF
jgi:hypothetical protein